MAKNANSTWVGKTARPQYQTYQTAGLLRPTPQPPVSPVTGTTPTQPVPTPVTPPPVAPPPGYPPIPVGPPAYPPPLPAKAQEPPTPREQLVNAVMRGGSGGGRSSSPV